MMTRWWLPLLFTLCAGLGTLGILFAQDPGRLYVVNALSNNISVIDTAADAVVGEIPLPAPGYQLAFTPDGAFACVTVAPEAGTAKAPPQLALVDLAAGQQRAVIPLGIYPLAMVHVSPDGRQAYVVTAAPPGERNIRRGQLFFVDLPSGKPVQALQVGLNPLGSAMTPDGSRLFTADWASHSITVVDLAQRRLRDTLPLGAAAARTLALGPDGRKLYAILERQAPAPAEGRTLNNATQNAYGNAQQVQQAFPPEERLLWEIDTASGAVAKFQLDGFSPVYALAAAPDGRSLYAYGRLPQAVPINGPQQQRSQPPAYALLQIDIASKRVVRQLGNFGYIAGLAFNRDGSKLYLVGTPGDPAQEAKARADYLRAQDSLNGPPANRGKGGATEELTAIVDQLRRLAKTVTVLDVRTGKTLKVIPVGSLPQGAGMAPTPVPAGKQVTGDR